MNLTLDLNQRRIITLRGKPSTNIYKEVIVMYDNIGSKIKGLATGVFIVEAIAAVIGGIVLLVDELIGLGLLTLFGGPVVAWVSSWLLYGFGETIDKLCDIEKNTRGGQVRTETFEKAKTEEQAKQETIKKVRKTHLINQEHTGNAPYYCKHCGNAGPYAGACPKCGSNQISLI